MRKLCWVWRHDQPPLRCPVLSSSHWRAALPGCLPACCHHASPSCKLAVRHRVGYRCWFGRTPLRPLNKELLCPAVGRRRRPCGRRQIAEHILRRPAHKVVRRRSREHGEAAATSANSSGAPGAVVRTPYRRTSRMPGRSLPLTPCLKASRYWRRAASAIGLYVLSIGMLYGAAMHRQRLEALTQSCPRRVGARRTARIGAKSMDDEARPVAKLSAYALHA